MYYARQAAGIAFVFLLALLIHFPAAHADAGQSVSPFARTGLLIKADESAEEILLRAHAFDTDAIALVIAGYKRGMGGFLHNGSLAKAWAVLASERLGLSHTASFFQLLSYDGYAPEEENSADLLAGCEDAKKSRFAPLFKANDVFDIDTMCADLAIYRRNTEQWRSEYEASLADMDKNAKDIRNVIALIRELPHRPLAEKDMEALRKLDVSAHDLLFFAATSHDPEREVPDWKAERLFDFISSRRAEKTDYADGISLDAMQTVMQRLSGTPGFITEHIRQAHGGSAEAASFLALQYQLGAMNFPRNFGLSNLWLRHAAYGGDPNYAELRAIQLYAVYPYSAWPWAKLAEECGAGPQKERMRHLSAMIEKEHGMEKLEKDYGKWLTDMRRKCASASIDRHDPVSGSTP